jgi:hypothetical protein
MLDPDIPLQVFVCKLHVPLFFSDVYEDDGRYDYCELSNNRK